MQRYNLVTDDGETSTSSFVAPGWLGFMFTDDAAASLLRTLEEAAAVVRRSRKRVSHAPIQRRIGAIQRAIFDIFKFEKKIEKRISDVSSN